MRQTYIPSPPRVSTQRTRQQSHRYSTASKRAMGNAETEGKRWQQKRIGWCARSIAFANKSVSDTR